MAARVLIAGAVVLATVGACSQQAPTSNGDGPISAIFSADFLKVERQVFEDLTTACMRLDGWDYVPDRTFVEGEPPDIDDLEFRSEYGFGLADPSGFTETGESAPSPNHMLMESLSEDARRRYVEALSGCREAVQEEIAQKHRDWAHALPSEVFDLVAAVETGDHPSVRAAVDQWRECMATEGFVYSDRPTMLDSLFDAVSGVVGPDGEIHDQASFDRVRTYELEVAVADHGCFEATIRRATAQLIDQADQLALAAGVLHPYEEES